MICEDHITAARAHVENPHLLAELEKAIEKECETLKDYRVVAERFHLDVDSRSKDRLVSFGERLSCKFVTAILQDRVGIPFISDFTWLKSV